MYVYATTTYNDNNKIGYENISIYPSFRTTALLVLYEQGSPMSKGLHNKSAMRHIFKVSGKKLISLARELVDLFNMVEE